MASPNPGTTVVAFPDLNPLDWLGDAAVGAAGDSWKNAMVGVWSAGLWLLELSFKVIDGFATPDVSATGPLAGALPTTMWLGVFVAVIVMSLQLSAALIRRDGEGLGQIVIGLVQFGAVWLCYLAVAGVLIVAAGALAQGILSSMLHVGSWAEYSVGQSWPRSVTDATAASVLGLCSLLMLIPAAFAYLLVMLVREAALIILLATAPISAAGLLNDTTKVWFWKTLRWFIASLLIAPAAALVLGVGVQLSNGVVQGAGTDTVASVGTAVVGCVLVLIGALCPMVLFKLLAFVDPGTSSGSALRQSVSNAGGVSGLLSGGRGGAAGQGSSAATAQSADGGGSQGEAAAESQTSSRMASMLGPVGAGIGAGIKVASQAADLASDVLGQAGVGDPGYAGYPGSSRTRQNGNGQGRPSGQQQGNGEQQPSGSDDVPPAGPEAGPVTPASPGPPTGGAPGPGRGAGPAAAGAGAGAGTAGGVGAGGVGAEAAGAAL